MKKAKVPPPKGQRSIASFMFSKKPAATQDGDQPNGTLPAASNAALAGPSGLGHPEDAPAAPPPSKRSRTEPEPSSQLPPPSLRTTTPANAEERHQRWQSKLLGDESAGMQRIYTQQALEQRGEAPKMTPLELQVAALQKKHPDCVLAIECGYKYRFFGKDAEIASNVLGIFSYPDRNYLTAGVPTFTIDRHIRRLVMAGYKVGQVRQTESAAIKAAGENRNKPFDRKLAAVYTRATFEAGELSAARPATAGEEESAAGAAGESQRYLDVSWGNEHRSAFLICIVEEPLESTAGSAVHASVQIGIVAVETSTGEVYYSEFADTPMRAELESRIMFTAPSELLLVEPLSGPTRRLLEAYGGAGKGDKSTVGNQLGVRTECVDGMQYKAGGALATVLDFYTNSGGRLAADETQVDAVMKLPRLVLRALAHALDHLRPFGLEAVLRLGAQFREFSEVQELTLSPNALAQLEILRNSDDGKERGSLLWLMDRTLTAAGARQVRRWVSRPLRNVAMIEERLSAVGELLEKGAEHPVLSALPGVLKELPDVERILGRVLHKTSSPPEFLALLQAFRDLYARLGMHADLDALHAAIAQHGGGENNETDSMDVSPSGIQLPAGLSSELLKRELLAAADLRCAAIAQATLASIDPEAAAAGDKLRLFADDARFQDVAEKRAAVAAAEAALEELRPELAKTLNIKTVNYVTVANQGEYLVEIPVDLEKRAPKTWEKVSSTKKVVRFKPPQVKNCLQTLALAKEHLALTASAAWTRLQSEFSEHYVIFRAAVRALAALDCLNGFAAVSASGSYSRPEFVDSSQPPQLHIIAGRHPVLDVLLEGSFVPNNIHLGSDVNSERVAVITGPNMGGKSCYMRQAALIVCMAQTGCFVPASSCKLHAFDAVFTRMGAADNLALGRSTFLEEMAEASTILEHATPRSLVIIDELGRGTSTQDGKAIAAATLEYISQSVGCLTLFVTHYPEVAKAGEVVASVGSYYMDFVVDEAGTNGNDDDDNSKSADEDNSKSADEAVIPKVTFLYKAVRGVAEASYGLNVARMAGISEEVVKRAAQKAHEMEAAAAVVDVGNGAAEKAYRKIVDGLKSIANGDRESVGRILELQRLVKLSI